MAKAKRTRRVRSVHVTFSIPKTLKERMDRVNESGRRTNWSKKISQALEEFIDEIETNEESYESWEEET